MIKIFPQSKKMQTRRILPWYGAIALFILMAISVLNACGEKTTINIAQLDPPWVFSKEVKFDPQNPRYIELAKIFGKMEDSWRVVDARYFLATGQRPTWDAVRHFVEGKLNEQGHFKIIVNELRYDDNSRLPIVIFSSDQIRREYIAVAMNNYSIDGKWLLGYFSLKK